MGGAYILQRTTQLNDVLYTKFSTLTFTVDRFETLCYQLVVPYEMSLSKTEPADHGLTKNYSWSILCPYKENYLCKLFQFGVFPFWCILTAYYLYYIDIISKHSCLKKL